ncbi:MAG TPA: YlmC/YmxH family sporulation protein [Firmicutes bacterium]|nr:YlmC/YmxH family sporulation protein [Bacillota bacterium]
MKASELRMRDVVNIADGRKLGYIYDLDVDLETGRINAVILPAPQKLFNFFGRGEDIQIPIERIKKIGVDVILVELPANVGA